MLGRPGNQNTEVRNKQFLSPSLFPKFANNIDVTHPLHRYEDESLQNQNLHEISIIIEN